ncbi:hypothetical protein BN938_0229 [Mucinivorans hirudinis]|uniref:DUF2007 domain-containing protein n=1 Tax=Mucinivorans hirudinis TaxID=1433126 RepID=A0A060R627_9BACT|nr:hypothetical protein BN938_0229 [Mucinivorans hirudinis]
METVVVKEYSSVTEAYIDRGLLESNGIDSEINGETWAGLYPNMPMVAPVSLIVRTEDEALAKELLKVE